MCSQSQLGRGGIAIRAPAAIIILGLVVLSPVALAGTAEAPEVTDPAGDCEFSPGNEYMDVVAAWVSGETATSFDVNIQLSTWTQAVADGAGFTVQFRHQGVEFGVLAGFIGQTWTYGNGKVSNKTIESFNETEGSFQADPPVITIQFDKANFPHADMSDDQLVGFVGGSLDLKPIIPFFFSPVTPPVMPDAIACDTIMGTVPYTFQVGAHAHSASAAADESAQTNETAVSNDVLPAATADEGAGDGGSGKGVPAPGLGLVVVAVLLFAFARRR